MKMELDKEMVGKMFRYGQREFKTKRNDTHKMFTFEGNLTLTSKDTITAKRSGDLDFRNTVELAKTMKAVIKLDDVDPLESNDRITFWEVHSCKFVVEPPVMEEEMVEVSREMCTELTTTRKGEMTLTLSNMPSNPIVLHQVAYGCAKQIDMVLLNMLTLRGMDVTDDEFLMYGLSQPDVIVHAGWYKLR